jgi:hypothetical protein
MSFEVGQGIGKPLLPTWLAVLGGSIIVWIKLIKTVAVVR